MHIQSTFLNENNYDESFKDTPIIYQIYNNNIYQALGKHLAFTIEKIDITKWRSTKGTFVLSSCSIFSSFYCKRSHDDEVQ